jgi:predicted DNA-binding ribbon-helix-helix protein
MPPKAIVIKRSVLVRGRNTSITLEDEFWEGFKLIAGLRRLTITELIGRIDAGRGPANLSSAIRLLVLKHYRTRAHRRVKRGLRQPSNRGNGVPKKHHK